MTRGSEWGAWPLSRKAALRLAANGCVRTGKRRKPSASGRLWEDTYGPVQFRNSAHLLAHFFVRSTGSMCEQWGVYEKPFICPPSPSSSAPRSAPLDCRRRCSCLLRACAAGPVFRREQFRSVRLPVAVDCIRVLLCAGRAILCPADDAASASTGNAERGPVHECLG